MTVPFATDYPFMGIFWSMLIFMAFFLWIWIAIAIFSDIFRRHDMGGVMKAIWILAIFVLPLLGSLIYLIAYNKGIAERNAKGAAAAQAAFDQHIREAAGAGGPAGEIHTAQKLLDAGTITQEEFDTIKAKALAR